VKVAANLRSGVEATNYYLSSSDTATFVDSLISTVKSKDYLSNVSTPTNTKSAPPSRPTSIPPKSDHGPTNSSSNRPKDSLPVPLQPATKSSSPGQKRKYEESENETQRKEPRLSKDSSQDSPYNPIFAKDEDNAMVDTQSIQPHMYSANNGFRDQQGTFGSFNGPTGPRTRAPKGTCYNYHSKWNQATTTSC
jgi:hypothetical protein